MIISCYQSKTWDFAAGSYSLLSFASRKQNLSGREKFQRTWNLSGFREKYCFAMHGWMRAPQLVWTACAEVSAFLRGTLSLRTHTPRHITKQKTLRKCRRFVKCLWRKAHDLAAWCEFTRRQSEADQQTCLHDSRARPRWRMKFWMRRDTLIENPGSKADIFPKGRFWKVRGIFSAGHL